MDLRDSPEQAIFRDEVRGWLAEHVPEMWKEIRAGSGGRSSLAEVLGEEEAVAFQKDWHRQLHEAGFIGLSWPEEYGGRGLSPALQFVYQEEYARAKPPPMINVIGLGWAGPAIISHGTEAQKERYLPKILSGEEVWCQLFSEPGAGSDLAGLATRAVRSDDGFVLNGQKVWTSIAQHAEWGICVARTDPDAPKHRGLSFFLVDMRDPGVEIRPIRQMNGAADFNEVFLTDVVVPGENLLGDLNDGWRVTLTTLMHERIGLSLGGGSLWGQGPDVHDLIEHMRDVDDRVLRHRLGGVVVDATVHRLLKVRMITAAERGGIPGAEASIQKLFGDELGQRLNALALEALGLGGGLLDGDAAAGGMWQSAFLFAPALTIGGGTTEVQKNIIGERILGLPKEP